MAKAQQNDTVTDTTSDELEKYTGFTREELKGIQSFEDVEALFRARGEEIDSASEEIGDGFALLDREQKDLLVDVPVMFVSWVFTKGDFGEFVSARAVTRLPNGTLGKFIVNDGSTGICRDLRQYTDEHNGKAGGLFAQKGLTRSDYTVKLPDPKTGELVDTPATTYYVNTSA